MIMRIEGFTNMKYDTFIFDLDGTLLNTIDDLTDSLNYALKKNNLNEYKVDEVKYFVGSGIKVMIERALKENIKAHTTKNGNNKFFSLFILPTSYIYCFIIF